MKWGWLGRFWLRMDGGMSPIAFWAAFNGVWRRCDTYGCTTPAIVSKHMDGAASWCFRHGCLDERRDVTWVPEVL